MPYLDIYTLGGALMLIANFSLSDEDQKIVIDILKKNVVKAYESVDGFTQDADAENTTVLNLVNAWSNKELIEEHSMTVNVTGVILDDRDEVVIQALVRLVN